MLTKQQKEQIIKDLADKIKRQKVLIFADFRGLKVKEAQDLRRKLKEVDGEYKVAKKTLIKIALEKAKKEIDVSQFDASLSLIFGYSDLISPVKTLVKFAKEHGRLKILGGLMEDKFLTLNEIKELAAIPSREELLAKLVRSLSSPIYGFVNVLEGNIRNLLLILKQIHPVK